MSAKIISLVSLVVKESQSVLILSRNESVVSLGRPSRLAVASRTSARQASTSTHAKGADRTEKLLAAVKAKADEYKEVLDKVS